MLNQELAKTQMSA